MAKITIEIIGSSEGGETSEKSREGAGVSKTISDIRSLILHPVKTVEGKLIKNEIVKYAIDSSMSLLTSNLQTSISRYANMGEDYIMQTEVSNITKSIDIAKGAISSVFGGAQIGTMVAPGIGTLVGAGIGLVSYSASQYIQYTSRMSSYYSALNASNYNLWYNETRSSLYDEGRGTEN